MTIFLPDGNRLTHGRHIPRLSKQQPKKIKTLSPLFDYYFSSVSIVFITNRVDTAAGFAFYYPHIRP